MKYKCIPAKFFWDVGVRFLSWECWDVWKRHDHFRRFSKKSEVFRRRPKSAEGEVIEKTLIHKIRDRKEGIVIYSFYTWFSFLTWVWVNIFLGNCVKQDGNNSYFSIRREKLVRRREIEVFNPQAWDSRLRRESWQVYSCNQSHRNFKRLLFVWWPHCVLAALKLTFCQQWLLLLVIGICHHTVQVYKVL